MSTTYWPTLRRRRLPVQADPNIIPFIDVLLVLLVIFMVTAPRPTTDLRVEMPSRNAYYSAEIAAAIVHVREGGAVEVGGAPVALEALAPAVLAEIFAANPDLDANQAYALAPVYVRADLDTAYANVVAALDQLAQDGFAKVGVVSQSAD